MNTPNWQNLRLNVWEMLLRRWLAYHPELTTEQQRWVDTFTSTLNRHDAETPLRLRWEMNQQLNTAMSHLLIS